MKFDYLELVNAVDESKLVPKVQLHEKFKYNIEGIGRKISIGEQIEIIESFKKYPFRDEDVDLDYPDIIFKVIENKEDSMAYMGL